jgi:thioredoxin reductase (NADPH)
MDLRTYPKSLDEIEDEGGVDPAGVPALSDELLSTAVAHEGHAGGPRLADEDDADASAAADD